jgi:hypothetical protein
MARITNKKVIFFVTSPRTPNKLLDEVKLLVENFSGRRWNVESQKEFYLKLASQDFYGGTPTGDLAFKARDRINRAPKALGLVDLQPSIKLTDTGQKYLYGKRSEETFLKQLLKFQLHSPFHIDNNELINVKPYLELTRLIYDLNGLSKLEIGLFVMQLTDYKEYETIKQKIIDFRGELKTIRDRKISYNSFVVETFNTELRKLFKDEIESNEISTRESDKKSLTKFLTTKRQNHLDYADASIRYLRATGLFSLDPFRNKIYVSKDKVADVEYIYSNIDRAPYVFTDENDYKQYLYSSTNVKLLVDNEQMLLEKIAVMDRALADSIAGSDIEAIKDAYDELQRNKIEEITQQEVSKLQSYDAFSDVMDIYNKIDKKEIVDPPLFLEWNTWRAFTMLDDGNIKGNFKVDDDGLPLYTAPGNTADIECKYSNFNMIVEVTMSSGQRQYEMEGEPVARHLGNTKKLGDKDAYCIFIAPTLSDATLAHYFILHKTSVAHYGGKSKIIPLSLDTFRVMLNNAYQAKKKPNAEDMKRFLEKASNHADTASDEAEWLSSINNEARLAFV